MEGYKKLATITTCGFRRELRARRVTVDFYFKFDEMEITYPIDPNERSSAYEFMWNLLSLVGVEKSEELIGKQVECHLDANHRIRELYLETNSGWRSMSVPFYF